MIKKKNREMKKQVMNFLSMALMVLVLFSCDGGSGKKGSGGKSLFTPVSSGCPVRNAGSN